MWKIVKYFQKEYAEDDEYVVDKYAEGGEACWGIIQKFVKYVAEK